MSGRHCDECDELITEQIRFVGGHLLCDKCADSQCLYICKECGAESPLGIGYVLSLGAVPEVKEPAPGCPNQHVKK